MAGKSDYLEDVILNHFLRGVSTAAGTAWVELYTTAPTDAGGGTPVSGGGYARVAVTFSAPSGGVTSNSATVDFGTASANWGTIVAFGLFDASSGGNLLYWNNLTNSKTVNNGDGCNFPASALSVTED